MADIVIRPAREEDIPRILELYGELSITTSKVEQEYGPSPDDYRQTLTEIDSVPGYNLLVAEGGGKVVGTMTLLIMPNLAHHTCPWAVVENLIIDSRHRGQKVGKMLMEHAITRAKEAGCYKLILTSNKKRRGAHRFYRSLGLEANSYGFSLYF